MPRLERSVTVNAPVEKVFSYVTDAKNMPEWLPGMVEVTDIVRTDQGVGSHYRWTYKMMGIPFHGENKTLEYLPNERLVLENTGIPSTWTWQFTPQDGGTRIDLAVEYSIPVPVLGKMAERIVTRQNEREADLAMANIKARLEG